VRENPYATGQEFFKYGRVPANELDGARGDVEFVLLLGDDGDWERFRWLLFNEVLEV